MAGRGRGRGSGESGRGRGQFSTGSSFMGGFSYGEVMETSKAESEKTFFPRQALPDTPDSTTRELRAQRFYRTLLRNLRFSAYHVAIPEAKNTSMAKYSDRFQDPVEVMPSMSDLEQKERLCQDFFPAATWQAFYEKKSRQTRKRVEKPEQSAQERLAAADKKEAEQSAGKNAGAHNSGDEQEEDEADEFDDEEENPDYDCNYFDAGDDDDDGGADDGGEATFD